mgnify:FL=1
MSANPDSPAASVPVPTVGRLLQLAWPIVISRSCQTVMGLADAIMVAHLGKAALAATTTGALNTMTFFVLPFGTVFIVSSFAAQLHGARDAAGARRYGFYGLAVAAITAVLSAFAVLLAPAALAQLGYEPEVRDLMTGYLQIRLLSAGAAIGIEALANYYGGLGNTRLPMLANVTAMTLNVPLNWVLINGANDLGIPALGVRGAALANAIATTLAFVGLLGCFLAGLGEPERAPRSKLRLDELYRTLRFGLPSGFNWFFEMLAFSFFVNVVVAGLGTTALAALMSVLQINGVAFMPGFALASAGAILVGQAIGAGAKDTVPPTVRRTLAVASTWMALMGALYIVIPGLLMRPFLDGKEGSEELLRAGTRMLILSGLWQLFDAVSMTMAETLRAAGDTAYTMWARIAIAWLIFVPGTLVTVRVFGGGDVAAVGWVVGYLALLSLVLWLRFRSGAWRKIDLTGEGPTGH